MVDEFIYQGKTKYPTGQCSHTLSEDFFDTFLLLNDSIAFWQSNLD